MLKSLYARMSAVLLALLLVTGLLYILLSLFTTRLYIQEGMQRLNLGLARYLVAQNLFIEAGRVNEKAIEESFKMLMDINPGIELYLLDSEGNIMGYSAPPEKVMLKKVSLRPVERLINGSASLPVLGDDPKDPAHKKVFSAAMVPSGGEKNGYLYIILGGEEYTSMTRMLEGSYILRLSMGVITVSLMVAIIVGLYSFNLMTRRLRALSSAVEDFRRDDFTEPVNVAGGEGPDDEIAMLGTVFSEMSDRIIRQMQKLRMADAQRRELVSNVSHDLRTPLASIHGYLERLYVKGDELGTDERKVHLEAALRGTRKLGKLVTNLFELTKLEAREVKPEFEPFNPEEIIFDIAQESRLSAEGKGINIVTESPGEVPFVMADIGLVERAIQNLIDNAIHYTPEGGTVTISLSPSDEYVTFSVSDTGEGIDESDLPHIFERFYRGKKHSGIDSGSAGLGLAISRHIVELHGGSLEVISRQGEGTTFTFSLPVSVTGGRRSAL